MQKRSLYPFLFFLGFAFIISAIWLNVNSSRNIKALAEQSAKGFEQKHAECQNLLNDLLSHPQGSSLTFLNNAFLNNGIALYTFKNDSLLSWNNACWPFIDSLSALKNDVGIIEHKSGLYFYVRKTSQQLSAYAICLIQARFEIQNNYLKNVYENWTCLQKSLKLCDLKNAQAQVFVNQKPLFGIQFTDNIFYDSRADNISAALFIAGFLIWLLAYLMAVSSGISLLAIALLGAVLLLLRVFMIYGQWPAFLYRSVLFDLHLFGNGQSFINAYLGDILLNAFVLLSIVLGLHLLSNRALNKRFTDVLQWLMLLFLVGQINDNLQSLVANSTLSFDFIHVFDNNLLLLPVFASYAAYAMALFILLYGIARRWSQLKYALPLQLALSTIIGLWYFKSHQNTDVFAGIWLPAFIILLFLTFRFSKQNLVLSLVVHVILFSFTCAKLLHGNIQENRRLDFALMAQYLSEKRDAILESEYNLIPDKIRSDQNFKNLLNLLPSAETEVVQKLKQDYFSGYFDRYNLDFSLFDERCTPLLPVKNPVLVNQGFFEDQIKQSSDSLPSALYFSSNHNIPSRYIAYIPLQNKRLYVLMEPKQFEETGSFPDLLIDQSLQKQNKLKNVSFAVYHAGMLTNRSGDFIYPDFYANAEGLSMQKGYFKHHVYNPEADTNVIISEPTKTWQYFFTFNSYLLLFFSAFIYLCYLLYLISFTPFFALSSLTRRIQTVIILLLLSSMSAVGLISGNLVIKQFEAKNQNQLSEKTRTMLSELNAQFKAAQLFDADQYNLINLKLKEYARLFNTPVSMFNAKGLLVNTSESKLYDLGLASTLANPLAYQKLKNLEQSAVCIHEKAGSLDYMSMYTPIFDDNKVFLGMINLPYFARQSDLSNELSGIISALINVYVILIVISVLAGVILSGYITRPLRLIQLQIAKISLGKQNEKITWNSKDEIGKLVHEYNHMLLKLEESANQLAQSERESAWREMAKQVAHEIKNPLTPMKLNLQYLQHLKKSNPDDFADKFEKMSLGIIEQIDSLASIAGEFSHFAKFPETQLQNINLVEIIDTATALFENQSLQFIRLNIPVKELWVKGDREQCLRVFNNLLKNAVQAVESSSDPRIEVLWIEDKPRVTIAVKDNGCGIDDNLKQKIFSPNFTTKSTGSGLGLAMVKNCMTGFGGAVSFESTLNKGSTFYLQFVPGNNGKS